jgi:WD40 repeat protein
MCLAFGDNKIATGSMDSSCILYDLETRKLLHKFKDHKISIVGLKFNNHNLITASFDGHI